MRFRLASVLALICASASVGAQGFKLEEATIASTHKAIQDGTITCTKITQAYINRIKAYNGTCTALVTADGKPIKPPAGRILGGTPVKYLAKTVKVSDFIP